MSLELGDSAYASILTCGPGDELYETFGHTAIRICDSANNIDYVFNYGAFDDFEHGFYLKFAKGQLDYCLIVEPYLFFLYEYQYYNRAVWEQKLLLERKELVALFRALVINAQPENMYYSYDFFRNNCATRVRDVIEQSLIDRKLFSNTFSSQPETYRSLVHKYTGSSKLWWRFGIDLLLGQVCDKNITTSQYMYVPMELMTQYDTTRFIGGNTLTEPAIQTLPDHRTPLPKSTSPTLVFWILFAVVALLTIISHIAKWSLYWFDGVLYGSVGLLSLLILYLWIISDHYCCNNNLNLLWANPLVIWMVFRLRHPNYIVSLITACILLCFLVGFTLWPQVFNPAVIPIALSILIRLVDRFFRSDWK